MFPTHFSLHPHSSLFHLYLIIFTSNFEVLFIYLYRYKHFSLIYKQSKPASLSPTIAGRQWLHPIPLSCFRKLQHNLQKFSLTVLKDYSSSEHLISFHLLPSRNNIWIRRSGFNCYGLMGPTLVLFLLYVNLFGMHPRSVLSYQLLTILAPWILIRIRWSISLVP